LRWGGRTPDAGWSGSGSGGVAAGRRAYSVELRIEVVGTRPWPLNPEHMVVFLDDQGRQWFPGFVTTTAAPPFAKLDADPGRHQTAWVTAEIPAGARIVGMSLSPYPRWPTPGTSDRPPRRD
jgi:hypothetical protein